MKILVLNCGSSSIKFDVIETDLDLIKANSEKTIIQGVIEKIGSNKSIVKFKCFGSKYKFEEKIENHNDALKRVISILTGDKPQILKDLNDISGIGHRVVHGGESFYQSIKIDEKVIKTIDECSKFAPLQNPHCLRGIKVAMEYFPNIPHVSVFDTSFHHSMPDHSYIYPLPYALYEKYKIRRYGFHGSSHRYVSMRAAEILNRDLGELKLITLHLGNGSSCCAISNGKSVDTSMGHTPLEGLMMGTRTGDIDPAVVLYIMEEEGLDSHEMNDLLNKQSGLLGVSGISNDLRDITMAKNEGSFRARLAMDMFCYRLKKYLSSYMGVLGGGRRRHFYGRNRR